MRYIELNPVRATMVEDPAHYRWTSYRANALGQTSQLLVPHSVYLSLGATDKARQAAYVTSDIISTKKTVSELRLAVNQNQPLGNERFYETIERMAERRREARPRGRPRLGGNVTNEDVKGQGDLGLRGKDRAWPKPGPFNPKRAPPRAAAGAFDRFQLA
jgi:hypothetical protein